MLRSVRQWALALMCLGLIGCAQNPAKMSQSEVEGLLKTELAEFKLKEMSITPNSGGGGFTGSGLGSDGTKYKITVIQDLNESKLSYTAVSESDPDEKKSGSLQLK